MDAVADIHQLIHSRRSIRRYAARPVSREVVERLLTAAVWSPSAHNRQPWRFVVLTEASAKEQLAQAMGDKLRADRLADGDPPAVVEQDATRSYARITEAPITILACLTLAEMDNYMDERRARAEYLMAVQSVAMALQNLLLAAHAEGLGACWMCAPLFCPAVVREALALPMDWEAQALITLGYPASADRRPAQRQPLGNVTLWR